MTGIASGEILKYDLAAAAHIAKVTNSLISELIGTNEAARITCIKPSGTTSLVLGTSSGIHAWHNDYYLRTMRFNKNEDIASYLMVNHPELCEDDVLRPTDTVCVRIPVKAPEGSILRTETALDTLERVKKFSTEWIKPGHINGDNTHNVSATISLKPEEWEPIGQWMWDNRDHYNGLSVLPYWGGTYKQAPFEDITKEEYETRIATLKHLDLTKVMELDDTVDFGQVAACSGGACLIE
jgi:ribonucleoside-diphosphate reductase alpha chain